MFSLRKMIITGIVLALIGWGGIALLVIFTLPTLGPRWLLFFLVVIAMSGTAMPVSAFLNMRFPSDPPVGGAVILRQSVWAGCYMSIILWLQLGRVLNPILAIFLAAGFIAIEFFIRIRERSQFTPEVPGQQPVDGENTPTEPTHE